MNTAELPAVAKSVFVDCKKCAAQRYHRVIAHTTATSAKVECEVCGAKKTYKVPSLAKKKVTRKPRAIKPKIEDVYQEWCSKVNTDNPPKYNMRQVFAAETAIDHPKFGLGIITISMNEKIDVIFKDGERSLVHNRT